MQDRPDLEALLTAVARFLDGVASGAPGRPLDAGTLYRLRIASHLCALASREVASQDEEDAAEVEILRLALPQTAPAEALRAGARGRRQAIRALERQLCAAIDADAAAGADAPSLDAARHEEAVVAVLRRRLQVANPRFDLGEDWP